MGPDNDRYIRETIKGANMIIAAWGASSKNVNKTRADEVVDMVTNLGHGLWALSITKHGHPGHPLYLPNDTHPIRWRASA